MSKMEIKFNEYEFSGLKLRMDESNYPWKNDKEASKYFDNLIEEGSDISKLKYKNLVKDMSVQNLHVAISKSVIFKGLAYVNLFFIALLVLMNMNLSFYVGLTTVGVTIMLGVGSVMLCNYFNTKANEIYALKDTCTDIVELAFCKE